MAKVTVFCGSATPRDPRLLEESRALGRLLAATGLELVYGGSRIGLMGACADAALDAGGVVHGVLPRRLQDRELAHQRLSSLRLTDTMAERKDLLLSDGDAYVTLPGGYGTLDELFEVLTMAQLGYHERPCYLVNSLGYYDGLVMFLDRAYQEGLVRAEHRPLCRVVPSVAALGEELRGLAG